ncbi:MAG: hypothetical protein Kow00128_18590 [Deltaproteobacteria bacterium]
MGRTPGVAAICLIVILAGVAGPAGVVRLEAASVPEADRLCAQADRDEQEAREALRRSEERKRFLQGAGGPAAGSPPATVPLAVSQSVRAQIAQVRAILPRIRQGAAAARQDRGVVPGLDQYFSRMDLLLSSALASAESCLSSPATCTVPPMSCPAPPEISVFTRNVQSADLIRQIQQQYREAAAEAQRACLGLAASLGGDLARMRQQGQAAATIPGGGTAASSFGDVDLYLRRAENLRREAAQYRLEADRAAGTTGYCAGRRPAAVPGAGNARALDEALRRFARSRGNERGLPLDGKVVDLKAEWERKWDRGPALAAGDVPLPKVRTGEGNESFFGRVDDLLSGKLPGYAPAKEYLTEQAPWWWYRAKSLYREADGQVELTEFITSRPKELAKDVATKLVETSLGPFGKSVTTAYKITGAVKSLGEEVAGILDQAPRVIVYGDAEQTRALYDRSSRAPVKFLNDLFDDVTGKFPAPRYRTADAGGGER